MLLEIDKITDIRANRFCFLAFGMICAAQSAEERLNFSQRQSDIGV